MMLFRGTILLFTLLSFTIMQVQCASQHVVNRQSNPDLKGNRKVQCIENVEVIDVQRKSSNNGFHRDVLTEVKISALSNSECHLLQVEHLPSTIYIDIYQIESRHSETKILTFEEIDVEMPSYLSSNHSILVYSAFQPTIDGTLYSKTTVPIHQRYQAISDRPDIYYVTAILPKPHFYLYCADSEDVNFMNCESTPFLAPCTALNITQCYWQSLQTTDIDELTFHVPIGQQKDLIMVTIVTIVVTIMGCLVLLVTMVKSDLDRKSHKN